MERLLQDYSEKDLLAVLEAEGNSKPQAMPAPREPEGLENAMRVLKDMGKKMPSKAVRPVNEAIDDAADDEEVLQLAADM